MFNHYNIFIRFYPPDNPILGKTLQEMVGALRASEHGKQRVCQSEYNYKCLDDERPEPPPSKYPLRRGKDGRMMKP
jgi:hypothetical protein